MTEEVKQASVSLKRPQIADMEAGENLRREIVAQDATRVPGNLSW